MRALPTILTLLVFAVAFSMAGANAEPEVAPVSSRAGGDADFDFVVIEGPQNQLTYRHGQLLKFVNLQEGHALYFSEREASETERQALGRLLAKAAEMEWEPRYDPGEEALDSGRRFGEYMFRVGVGGEVLETFVIGARAMPSPLRDLHLFLAGAMVDPEILEAKRWLSIFPLNRPVFAGQTWAEYFIEQGKKPTALPEPPASLARALRVSGYVANPSDEEWDYFGKNLASLGEPTFVEIGGERFEVSFGQHPAPARSEVLPLKTPITPTTPDPKQP